MGRFARISSTQRSSLASVWLWCCWTLSSLCGLSQHRVHISRGGERSPVWHFWRALECPAEKGPHIAECYASGIHNLGYSRMRPHDLVFLEEWSGYHHILCWALPAAVCHTFTPSGAANAVLTACHFESCQHFSQGGEKNTQPAGRSSGACSRITSNSVSWGSGRAEHGKDISAARLCKTVFFSWQQLKDSPL